MKGDLFATTPNSFAEEFFEDLIQTETVRIERIVSQGQSSPPSGWYDQDENEWVLVLSGYGVIEFEEGTTVRLNPGECLNIQSHQKHRVVETSPKEKTIWLAVFYK